MISSQTIIAKQLVSFHLHCMNYQHVIIVHSSISLIGCHSQYAVTKEGNIETGQAKVGPEVGLWRQPAGVSSHVAFRSEQHVCTKDKNTAGRTAPRAAVLRDALNYNKLRTVSLLQTRLAAYWHLDVIILAGCYQLSTCLHFCVNVI